MHFDTPPTCAGLLCDAIPPDAHHVALAEGLGVPILREAPQALFLHATASGLELHDARTRPAIVTRVDFSSARMQYRQQEGRIRSELLAKAVGKEAHVRIVDATAGFGRDAFLLAAAGHHVTALERMPITAALLFDGVQRAHTNPTTAEAARRLQVIHADATSWLSNCSDEERPDVIYCDPIFPEKRKQAAVKKDMQCMRLLAGPDHDADQLFETAIRVARRRVVVKRWQNAAPLHPGVDFAVSGKTIRYDVYLIAPE